MVKNFMLKNGQGVGEKVEKYPLIIPLSASDAFRNPSFKITNLNQKMESFKIFFRFVCLHYYHMGHSSSAVHT